jgi:choline dehydrogenase-like flavoprotein
VPNNFGPEGRYKNIIIGSGAGGSTAFVDLSSSGKTLLIEEGTDTAKTIRNVPISEAFERLYRDSGVRPALGLPSLAIGEGRCLGGSTEINGGLFWRTPRFILNEWSLRGFSFAKDDELTPFFLELEQELSVQDEIQVENYDLDSKILQDACRRKNWKVVPARRMAPRCLKSNLCPNGCPTDAKQTMSRTLIPRGMRAGGEVLTGWRAINIISRTHEVEVELENPQGEKRKIISDGVIVSCGAIESRRLLKQSGLLRQKMGRIHLHVNCKVIVEFPEKIRSQDGTIFTHQLQEFIDDGFLLMSSNFNASYLALAANTMSPLDYRQYQQKIDHLAIFTMQFKPTSKIIDFHLFGKNFVLLFFLKKQDLLKMKKYFELTSNLLFDAGAVSLKLPFFSTPIVRTKSEGLEQIYRVKRGILSLTTVHLMSSIPLPGKGQRKSHIDGWGRLKGHPRVRVLDASIIPSSIGESPQGTIMALVRYLMRKENQ